MDETSYSEDFKSDVLASIKQLDEKQELKEIHNNLKTVLNAISIDPPVSWKEAESIVELLDKNLFVSEKRFNQGYTLLSVKLILIVAKFSLFSKEKLVNYSDNFDWVFDKAISSLNRLISTVSAWDQLELSNQLFEVINKESKKKYYRQYYPQCFELLNETIPLISKENKNVLFESIDIIIANTNDPLDRIYCERASEVLEMNVLLSLDGTEKTKSYIDGHLYNDIIREKRVNIAIDESDFSLAELLINEQLEKDETLDYTDLKKWYNYLLLIYRKTKERDKEAEILETMLLKGDIEQMSTLKNILQNLGFWETDKAILLRKIKEKLPVNDYKNIVIDEQDWPKLMELVESGDADIIDNAKYLVEYNPTKAIRLYKQNIFDRAKFATTESSWNEILSDVYNFGQLGYLDEMNEWLDELNSDYGSQQIYVNTFKNIFN